MALFGVTACGEADPDPAAYLGEFLYEEGVVRATCDGTRISQDVRGIEVLIARAGAGLSFVAGPRCNIRLRIDDAGAYGPSGQSCRISVSQTVASAVFSEFQLVLDAGALRQEAAGTVELIVPDAAQLTCERFSLAGRLVRRDR